MNNIVHKNNKTYCKGNVVMLFTKDKSNIYKQLEGNLGYSKDLSDYRWTANQHLYITSDEEIKEGDWCYRIDTREVFKTGKTSQSYIGKAGTGGVDKLLCKKIIATTDAKLWKKGHHSEGNIKVPFTQIQQSFIEQYVKEGGIDEVLVEWDRRNMYSSCNQINRLLLNQDNTLNIEFVEEKVFTLSELQKLKSDIQHICSWYQGREVDRCEKIENWLEENL